MRSIILCLQINADDFQHLYEGTVKQVVAQSIDGQRVRFPANILRPFVTHAGISSRFAIYFNEDNRFLRMEKID